MAYTQRLNEIYKGGETNQGNVAQYFETYAHLIALNDGKHEFAVLTEDCHDNPAP
jgi:hypothetical protein